MTKFEPNKEWPLSSNSLAANEFLGVHRQQYLDLATAIIPPMTEEEIRWRFIFAILSTNSPFDATCVAYENLRLSTSSKSSPLRKRDIVSLLRSSKGNAGPVMYHNVKAKSILSLKVPTLTGGLEKWRTECVGKIHGLGIAKASFAICLLYPHWADFCCIDTHMWRFLTGNVASKGISPPQYRWAENEIATIAQRHGVAPFIAQWGIWDMMRGRTEDHAVLRPVPV